MLEATINNNLARNLKVVCDRLGAVKLPGKLAYAVYKNADMLDAALAPFYKVEKDLVDEAAQRDEDGKYVATEDKKGIKLDPDKADKYQKDMLDLLREEVEVKIHQVDDSLFGEIEEIEPGLLKLAQFLSSDFKSFKDKEEETDADEGEPEDAKAEAAN